jgi:hypothetical protein
MWLLEYVLHTQVLENVNSAMDVNIDTRKWRRSKWFAGNGKKALVSMAICASFYTKDLEMVERVKLPVSESNELLRRMLILPVI